MRDGGSEQGATIYDIPASAPVGRCSARKRCMYFRNIASSGRRFRIFFFFTLIHFSMRANCVGSRSRCRLSKLAYRPRFAWLL